MRIVVSVDLKVDLRPGQDPVELEGAIASEGRRAARELYEQVLRAADEQAVAGSGGARQRQECRWVSTLIGRLRVYRYRVKGQGGSFHPLDRTMGLERGEASAALRSLVLDLSQRLSYRQIAGVVAQVIGEPFSYQQVGRIVGEHQARVLSFGRDTAPNS